MNNLFFDFDLFVVPERDQHTINAQGQGSKRLLVVFEPNDEPEELSRFLAKVLQAAKIDMNEDAYLLPLHVEEKLNLSAFCQDKDIRQVIIFGLSPDNLGLHYNYKRYTPFVFRNRTYLIADSLPAIYEERQAGGKRMSGALWKALKEVFLN